MIALAARAFVIRYGINLLRVLLAALFVLFWSGCSGAGSVVLRASEPGGQANLRNTAISGNLSLGGTGILLGPAGSASTAIAPEPGMPGFIGPVQGSTILPAPPADQWAMMLFAAESAPCRLSHGATLLAAVAFYESSYGKNLGPTSTGNTGYGMFSAANYAKYGVPPAQGGDFRVMLPAMVHKLCDDGGATDERLALFHYNGSWAYADHIEALTASWGGISTLLWHDLAAINQFDPRNWANSQNFQIWSGAACSAAALDWMLNAFGTPVSSLDAALSLIGPNTSISSRVGLLDHTGPALKAAFQKTGYSAWNRQLTQAQLVQQLQSGPVMLDGQRWFGVGHWFVAIGSNSAGIAVRESSGNNVTFLSWAQLSSEVGWSGWAVGVTPPSVPTNQA